MPARIGILLIAVLLAACEPDAATGFRESESSFRVVRESLYNQISVERTGDEVEMRFQVGRRTTRQTAVDLSNPLRLVIPYTRFMLAAALVEPQPRRVLLIGLGGGGLNRFLRSVYPNTRLHTAELDPVVLEMARQFMGFLPDEMDEVIVEDGRTFLKRNPDLWSWILVDAYRDSTVPPHLKTQEFYKLLQDRLAPGGAIAFNLHSGTRLFASDLATLRSVFGEVHLFGVAGTGNVIALAFGTRPAGFPQVDFAAAASATQYPDLLLGHLHGIVSEYGGVAGSSSAPVLTDDFAPTEFLEQHLNYLDVGASVGRSPNDKR